MEMGPSKIGGWLSVMAPLWPLGVARILYDHGLQGVLGQRDDSPLDFLRLHDAGVTETFIGVTLILGLFARLGAFVALGMAANITVGILSVPHEWGSTYAMLIMFATVFLLTRPGRSLGVYDALPVRSVNLGTGNNLVRVRA